MPLKAQSKMFYMTCCPETKKGVMSLMVATELRLRLEEHRAPDPTLTQTFYSQQLVITIPPTLT